MADEWSMFIKYEAMEMLMKESEKDDFLREQQMAQIHRQKSRVSHAWNSWEVKIWENDQDTPPPKGYKL